MRTRYPWLLTLGIVSTTPGCGEDEKADSTNASDTDTDMDADVDCAALDVDTCATTAACRTIDGRPLSTDPASGVLCVDFSVKPEPLGCMDAEGGCGDAETLGTAGGACSHWFPSTCLPQGWSACEEPSWVESCP